MADLDGLTQKIVNNSLPVINMVKTLTTLQKLTIVKPVSENNSPLNYIENGTFMVNSM